jgi:hypothetical protein
VKVFGLQKNFAQSFFVIQAAKVDPIWQTFLSIQITLVTLVKIYPFASLTNYTGVERPQLRRNCGMGSCQSCKRVEFYRIEPHGFLRTLNLSKFVSHDQNFKQTKC